MYYMKVLQCTTNDVKSITKWMTHRQLSTAFERIENSFIIRGVAACSLLRAENGVCILDSVVTNPLCSLETRSKALDALFDYAKQKTVELGYKRLIGFTKSNSTLMRASRHGFIAQPHILMTWEST